MSNVTSETIVNAINHDYSGDVLAFLSDLVDYCNARTTFGIPLKHSPLEEVRYECNSVLCTTCDALLDLSDEAEPAVVELEEDYDTESCSVCVTRYYLDTGDLVPEDWSPSFIVTCPRELARLCEYVGVNFDSNFFEE